MITNSCSEETGRQTRLDKSTYKTNKITCRLASCCDQYTFPHVAIKADSLQTERVQRSNITIPSHLGILLPTLHVSFSSIHLTG